MKEIESWKEYWLGRQENPSTKREISEEKRLIRRKINKKERKKVRDDLRNWNEDYWLDNEGDIE